MNMYIIKKNGSRQEWEPNKIVEAVKKSAFRANRSLSDIEYQKVVDFVQGQIEAFGRDEIPVEFVHNAVEGALKNIAPTVAECYISYHNWRKQQAREMDEAYMYKNSLDFRDNEKENANKDGAIVSTKRTLVMSYIYRKWYENYFLTASELRDVKDGYIYPHDEDQRLDTMNCCLFNWKAVLEGGFEMANVHYNEPKRITTAFGVISDIVLSAASQQYGGFTLPEVDKGLAKYAQMSYDEYVAKMMSRGISEEDARKYAKEDTIRDIRQSYQEWEMKWNTVASSRGDYPFITITFGLGTGEWEKEISKAILEVHKEGQGEEGKKKAVLFPKLVFLYDKELCQGVNRDVYDAGVECSIQTMYPDWLSMTGEGYISSMYKKYKKPISPMGCRAFLSPWYERGGHEPADENDVPVFVGRFNIGAISLNLPMILAKSREDNRDFYSLLDEYLQEIREIHQRTYEYLSRKKAGTNPLAYCQGGFYNPDTNGPSYLDPSDTIAPLLKCATASFGITALNELQRLYNGKSLVEDGQFARDVLKYINVRVNEFKEEDGHLYAIYGTPAEGLCYKQVDQFRAKYGIIENVSDREYVSNSFHCHVTEHILPIEKQNLEGRFWELCNGGKIQYVKYPSRDNKVAFYTLIERAMEMGFYEGVNLDLNYCDDCGYEATDIEDECPCCHGRNITKINRMNGYLAYSRVHGDTRLNRGKMAEIAERFSM